MGTRNIITKRYISNNEKFADLCNYCLFDGKSVISPEDLKEKDVTELGISFSEKGIMATEKIRDILKSCTLKSANGISYLIIGIENQTDIHYAMAVRNMLMDALNYAAQVDAYSKKHRKAKDLKGDEFLSGFSNSDKLLPVVTITLYWSANDWSGARSLHEMLDVKDSNILKFIPNYKINLVVPSEIKDFTKFRTELGPVLEFCQCSNDKEKLKKLRKAKEKEGFLLERESAEVLNECVNAGIKLPAEKGVKVDMCKAMEELFQEGNLEGQERLSKLIQALLNENKYEEIRLVTSDQKLRDEYYVKYGI